MAEKTLHKIGDKVFVYVSPNDLVDPTQDPIFECEVTTVFQNIREDENERKEEFRYLVESGLDDINVSAERVFGNRDCAITFAKGELARGIERLEKMLADRRATLAALE